MTPAQPPGSSGLAGAARTTGATSLSQRWTKPLGALKRTWGEAGQTTCAAAIPAARPVACCARCRNCRHRGVLPPIRSLPMAPSPPARPRSAAAAPMAARPTATCSTPQLHSYMLHRRLTARSTRVCDVSARSTRVCGVAAAARRVGVSGRVGEPEHVHWLSQAQLSPLHGTSVLSAGQTPRQYRDVSCCPDRQRGEVDARHCSAPGVLFEHRGYREAAHRQARAFPCCVR